MKYSPGNWEPEFVGHGGPGDNPVEIWEVTNGHARIAENMTEADARLIAVAPEMKLALVQLLNEHDALQMAEGSHGDRWPAATFARAILNKINA